MNRFGTSAPYSQVRVMHSVSDPGLCIWIRIQEFCWIRIRIQAVVESGSASRLLLNPNPDPDKFFIWENLLKIYNRKFFGSKSVMYVFFNLYKLCSFSSSGMKFSFFSFTENKFSLPRYGSAGPIELWSNPDPDLKHWLPGTTYRELVYDNFHVDNWTRYKCTIPTNLGISFFPVSYCKYY